MSAEDSSLEPRAPLDAAPMPPERPQNAATERLWKAFPRMAVELRRWALTAGELVTVGRGQAVWGSEIMVVVSGCAVVQTGDGKLTDAVAGPGDWLASGVGREVSARWLTDGECYRVPLAAWEQAAGAAVLMPALSETDRSLFRAERRIRCLASHPASARLADMLLFMHEASAHAVISISQSELADMLGLRRTTVNTSFQAFQQVQATSTARGKVRISSRSALATIACGCRRTDTAGRPSAGKALDLNIRPSRQRP